MIKEIYLVSDVEADGPIPGINSMVSFASVAIDPNTWKEIGHFACNLFPIKGAVQDPDTMQWWSEHPDALKESQKDQRDPEIAMKEYCAWCNKLPERPVFVGEPACYDFMFLYWYCIRFAGQKPFSFSGIDVKTMAMMALNCDYRSATKRNFPRHWFNPQKRHTHTALDDAREQAYIFEKIYRSVMNKHPTK